MRVWDANTGRETLALKGHAETVFGVAISPSAMRIASASGDRTVKLWDAITGRETLAFRGNTEEVFAVAFSPEGMRIASADGGTIHIWDAREK